jgi:hypothetical protein
MYPFDSDHSEVYLHSRQRDFASFDTWDLPDEMHFDDSPIKNEREFHQMIQLSKRVQRSLGWQEIKSSGIAFPDVKAQLINGYLLRVEIEFNASNFLIHRHKPGRCDLILSWIREPEMHQIGGTPVWSFYKKDGPMIKWTLRHDIRKHDGVFDAEYYYAS